MPGSSSIAGGRTKRARIHLLNWVIQKGLGSLAPLLDDAEVIESTKKWGDITLNQEEAALSRGASTSDHLVSGVGAVLLVATPGRVSQQTPPRCFSRIGEEGD